MDVGYFNIPSVGTNTGVSLLFPFSEDLMTLAMNCARGVVKDVSEERFWRSEQSKYDARAILFDQPKSTAAKPGEVLS